MTENKNPWIEWNGGEMPVEKGTLINVKYRNKHIYYNQKAGEDDENIEHTYCPKYWHNDGSMDDIIAYQLVEQPFFDLEAARNGAPVWTREGKEVKILEITDHGIVVAVKLKIWETRNCDLFGICLGFNSSLDLTTIPPEKPWYEKHLPGKVLCWVNDRENLRIITKYKDDIFIADNGVDWPEAVPATSEELSKYLLENLEK